MNKLFLLKILKVTFHVGKKLLIFSGKAALIFLFDEKTNRRIKAKRKWNNEYDAYAAVIAKRKHF